MSHNDSQHEPYQVETEEFSGPLHLLLELIEKDELPITDISLAKVTEQFLSYVESQEVSSEVLADFLVVATRLLYLKSRELMPDLEDEEENTVDLTDQLRLYKIFADASVLIDKRYSDSAMMWARAKSSLPKPEVVEFSTGLDAVALEGAFSQLLKRIRPFLYLRRTTMERVRSVGERMEELRALIRKKATLAFRDLTKTAKSKMEIVLNFLALLELVKQKTVRTAQSKTFSDITINRV